MVVILKKGSIIKLNFNPIVGHEQKGYRPALVVSNEFFNEKTNLTIVCPITNTINKFPLHVELDGRTKTKGSILCEHIKSIDLIERGYTFIEEVPKDILDKVIQIIKAEL